MCMGLVTSYRRNYIAVLVVISYHLVSYVTILLGKLICWPLNVGKKKKHINTGNTLVTAKRWPQPLNRGGC